MARLRLARPAVKIAFIGPCSSGKTSIITRFHEGTFSDRAKPTVGAGFVTHDLTTTNGTVSLNIWDTAGQERYKSLTPMYCRGAVGLIVVFDCTSEQSFTESKEWCERFRSTDQDIPQRVFYVANKVDLEPVVGLHETAETYAKSIQAQLCRTSAMTGEGIQALFQAIADGVVGLKRSAVQNGMPQPDKNAGEKGCC